MSAAASTACVAAVLVLHTYILRRRRQYSRKFSCDNCRTHAWEATDTHASNTEQLAFKPLDVICVAWLLSLPLDNYQLASLTCNSPFSGTSLPARNADAFIVTRYLVCRDELLLRQCSKLLCCRISLLCCVHVNCNNHPLFLDMFTESLERFRGCCGCCQNPCAQ